MSRIEVPARHHQGAPTALSPNGQWLAMGGTDDALSVWKVASGDPLVRGALPADPGALALSPKTVVVAGRSGFAAYRRRDGAVTELPLGFPPSQVLALPGDRWLLVDHDRVLVATSLEVRPKAAFELGRYTSGAAAVSSDGIWLAAPVGEKVEIRRLPTGVETGSLACERPVTACAFFPGGGSWLAIAAEDVQIWNLADPPVKVATVALPEGAIVYGLAVSESGRIAASYDPGPSSVFSNESAVAFVDPRAAKVTATLKRPGVRLGQVAFVGGARVVVTDSSGRLLLADGAKGEWLESREGSDVDLQAFTIRALPLAVSLTKDGAEVAHLDPDGNVRVRTLGLAKPDAERFELAPPVKSVRPGSQGLFADRLRGACLLIGGKLGAKKTRFVAETIEALGGSLAAKASASVTHAAFAHPLYGKVVPSANERAIDRLIAEGASILKLSVPELEELLLPTREEARAMLGGLTKGGVARWNAWRELYADASGLFPAKLRGIDLSGADLREARLASIHFEEAILEGVRLERVDLFDTVFRGARMRGANLDGASCYRTNFTGADLSNAKLNGDFTWAQLGSANLEGADLRRANLFKADSKGAKTSGARMPERKK